LSFQESSLCAKPFTGRAVADTTAKRSSVLVAGAIMLLRFTRIPPWVRASFRARIPVNGGRLARRTELSKKVTGLVASSRCWLRPDADRCDAPTRRGGGINPL
jgi:hypothetical protein